MRALLVIPGLPLRHVREEQDPVITTRNPSPQKRSRHEISGPVAPERARDTALCGRALPPDRWKDAGRRDAPRTLLEASDPKPVFELVSEWQEFMEMEATPVLEDDDAGGIFAKLYG